jgi:hypothetical protein
MAITNHERVGKALDLLKAGLGPFGGRGTLLINVTKYNRHFVVNEIDETKAVKLHEKGNGVYAFREREISLVWSDRDVRCLK